MSVPWFDALEGDRVFFDVPPDPAPAGEWWVTHADAAYERGRQYAASDASGFAAGLFGALTAGWDEEDAETAEALARSGERIALREAKGLAAAWAVGKFLRGTAA